MDMTPGVGHPAYGLNVTGQSTTCAGGVATATTNNTGVLLTGGTIPAGGSCTVTVNYTGTVQTAGTPISVTNTIAQGAVGVTTAGIVSQTASAALIIADDLRVTKTANPAQAAPGNPVQYSVTVENFSTSAINNVVITDTLSNGLTYLTGTINGGSNYSPGISGGCGALGVTGAVGATAPAFTIGTLPARVNINGGQLHRHFLSCRMSRRPTVLPPAIRLQRGASVTTPGPPAMAEAQILLAAQLTRRRSR